MEDAEPQPHEHEMAWLVGHGEPVLPNRAQGSQVTPMPRRSGVWVDAYYCCSRAHLQVRAAPSFRVSAQADPKVAIAADRGTSGRDIRAPTCAGSLYNL
jgi:hypothetical protein